MTSASNPIRVDWVETALWPGRLGLTFAPGKKGASLVQRGVTHDRDVRDDMQTLARSGVNVIAPLIEEGEFTLLGMDGYHQIAADQGFMVLPYPIPDQHAPQDTAAFAAFIDELNTHLMDGRSVAVHCRGGLGRAGLVGACLLVQNGMDAAEAIAKVRLTRPGTVETEEQVRFIRDFAER